MLSRSLLFSVAFAGVVYSQTVIVTNSDVDSELSATGKIIRPNVTITTSQRRVYVPKGKSLKFGDSPILKLSFQPSAKLSKALSFSEPKSSQFFHLVPSTPTPVKPESTSLAPPAPTKMRSVHRISNTTYQMPADFLCEGLDCPKGHQCSLAQPTCTPEDCSLKPSCAKKLSDHCEKCQPPCVHAILNLDAPGGCHPCLCEVTVFRPPPRLAKRLAAIAAQ
ncbi:uncharacterized protein LOC100902751 isoform X1 [Galendromus occidentalis]|uniref:Uncharacterized protein LOC100902751 isoform X1 n=1 Tax=Galendromus occidentalis TaxID=34638 RepID=A0AAJ7PAJ8_9ACAR|nr:uncharacterized protein LOC100902751 isoform X1 [Galendromus occidentalis]